MTMDPPTEYVHEGVVTAWMHDQLRPADTSIVDKIFQVRAHKRGGSGSSCTVHSLEGGHHISISLIACFIGIT